VLVDVIDHDIIHEKKAVDMATLLKQYKELLKDDIPLGENYRSEKLKYRLQNHYGDEIVFQAQIGKHQSGLVYSSTIKVEDVINMAASMMNESTGVSKQELSEPDINSHVRNIFHTAQIVRRDLKDSIGLDIRYEKK
jgi:hypothetical protein